ncbi:MAG: DUF2169 domain-containing protein [Gammaproteobacteria bacterium]|nr:DUF2169 domain-containing protein [Gammaproteobacteria bacterium]MDH5728414.1 DUF2169 domain-containing protein [Gammaproteobacteria bacterium]
MAYQGIDNKTLFTADLALLNDEDGRDVLLTLVKCTYDISPQGKLSLADEQQALCLEGEYVGEPGTSSLKIASEACFAKENTDVAFIGHAWAPKGKLVRQMDVSLRVGNLSQNLRVSGDRYWRREGLLVKTWSISKPEPFDKIPIQFERAFGGQDLSPEKEKYHFYEKRNLLGCGVIAKHSQLNEVKVPNIENPKQLIKKITDRPDPVGLGFITPDCEPRLSLSGTYDTDWQQNRMPLLPKNFQRRFFNSAFPSLIANGYLQGGEKVSLDGLSEEGLLGFYLPNEKPVAVLNMAYEDPQQLEVNMDTLLINTDDMQLTILWRAQQNVFNRLYDIEKVEVMNLSEYIKAEQAA